MFLDRPPNYNDYRVQLRERLLHGFLHLLSSSEHRRSKTGIQKPQYLFHDIKIRRFDACDTLARGFLDHLHLGPRILVMYKVDRDTLATKASRSPWTSRRFHHQKSSSTVEKPTYRCGGYTSQYLAAGQRSHLFPRDHS